MQKYLSTSKEHEAAFGSIDLIPNEDQRKIVKDYITTLERKIMGLEQTNRNLSEKIQRRYESLYR